MQNRLGYCKKLIPAFYTKGFRLIRECSLMLVYGMTSHDKLCHRMTQKLNKFLNKLLDTSTAKMIYYVLLMNKLIRTPRFLSRVSHIADQFKRLLNNANGVQDPATSLRQIAEIEHQIKIIETGEQKNGTTTES